MRASEKLAMSHDEGPGLAPGGKFDEFRAIHEIGEYPHEEYVARRSKRWVDDGSDAKHGMRSRR